MFVVYWNYLQKYSYSVLTFISICQTNGFQTTDSHFFFPVSIFVTDCDLRWITQFHHTSILLLQEKCVAVHPPTSPRASSSLPPGCRGGCPPPAPRPTSSTCPDASPMAAGTPATPVCFCREGWALAASPVRTASTEGCPPPPRPATPGRGATARPSRTTRTCCECREAPTAARDSGRGCPPWPSEPI